MTSPQSRALAEKIGKKAVSDEYVEDGGYIRDWLVDDIEKAIQQAVAAERERCAKIATDYDGKGLTPFYDWVSTKTAIAQAIRGGGEA